MGKQTNKSGSHFGGQWTREKLHIIDEYLKVYTIALKNQKFKKIYVDGFAGSGKTELKAKSKEDSGILPLEIEDDVFVITEANDNVIDGSALISLKYDFDEYYFLEIDDERIKTLKRNISEKYPEKINKVNFLKGDSNINIRKVISQITGYARCVMFLDPYALELDWGVLETISKCSGVDLWYLFPINALSRMLPKDGNVNDICREKVNKILGTDEWEKKLYFKSQQIDMFGNEHYDRIDFYALIEFMKKRFSEIFPFVSPNSKLLKNESKNSPMFLLCFMMTNSQESAVKLANKIVKAIVSSTEKLK